MNKTYQPPVGPLIILALQAVGFSRVRSRGIHHFMRHPNGLELIIPAKYGEKLALGLITRIKALGITLDTPKISTDPEPDDNSAGADKALEVSDEGFRLSEEVQGRGLDGCGGRHRVERLPRLDETELDFEPNEALGRPLT